MSGIVSSWSTGASLTLEEGFACKILSGWVGLYSATADELRLFHVLIPGDILADHPDCIARALTDVRTEPTLRPQSNEPLQRQCFRLSQYAAIERIADFLLYTFYRLKNARCTEGNSYRMPLTQQQLGELLGLSMVHVNRTLAMLRPRFRIENRRVYIEIREETLDPSVPAMMH